MTSQGEQTSKGSGRGALQSQTGPPTGGTLVTRTKSDMIRMEGQLKHSVEELERAKEDCNV